MTKSKEKGKAGRPKKEVDWGQFEKLCGLQCTQTEIAAFLEIHVENLRTKAREHYKEVDFTLIIKRYAEKGKCSLRRNQFVLSSKNAAMAIFLGKNYLGQTDGNEKMQELVVHEVREGIRRLSQEQRSEAVKHSALAS